MRSELDHITAVEGWCEGLAVLGPSDVLTAFERAFAAVWRRANATLGDVTLTAIGDRVIYDASERFPDQRGCRLEVDGLDATELRRQLGGAALSTEHLVRFARFVLTELLTVIGALTAEVLTPALHRALQGESRE